MRALLLSILTFMAATPAFGQVGRTSEAGQASAPSLRSLIELRPTEAPASDLAGPEEDAPLDWVTGSDVGVGFAGALLGGAAAAVAMSTAQGHGADQSEHRASVIVASVGGALLGAASALLLKHSHQASVDGALTW